MPPSRKDPSSTGNQSSSPSSAADSSAEPSQRRPLPLGIKLLFSFACLFTALLVCETVVRVRAYIRYGGSTGGAVDPLLVMDDELGIRIPRANHQQHGKLVRIGINSLGFRGAELEKSKPSGTFRIACIGASTTFCAEASNDEATWPAQLQATLNDRYNYPIEVINAGLPGARAEQSLINLKHRVLPLAPDLVIVYHANNDMAEDTRQLALAAGITKEGNRTPAWIRFASRHSLLAELAYKNLKIAGAGQDQPTLESLPNDIASGFETKLGAIVEVARANNTKVLLSTFLTKYRSEQSAEEQTKNADVAFYYMPWLNIEQLISTMDAYNQAILDVAAASDVPVVSERNSIPADGEHFADCMHLRDLGCNRMAQRFADYLQQSQLLPDQIKTTE